MLFLLISNLHKLPHESTDLQLCVTSKVVTTTTLQLLHIKDLVASPITHAPQPSMHKPAMLFKNHQLSFRDKVVQPFMHKQRCPQFFHLIQHLHLFRIDIRIHQRPVFIRPIITHKLTSLIKSEYTTAPRAYDIMYAK